MATHGYVLPSATLIERRTLAAWNDIRAPRRLVLLKARGRVKAGDTRRTPKGVSQTKLDALTGKARRILANKEVRQRICAGLHGVADDVRAIIKRIAPYAVGIGVWVGAPLDPYLVALIAMMIWKFGVSSYCFDAQSKGGKRKSRKKDISK